jgi:glyoxylase-like metal-dependent hydrolase (beta-lactamase superfamily II)
MWLRMPLPFQLDHINLWLLEDGSGWTVVDTGVGLDEVRALWEGVFGTRFAGRPVTRVVVTHFHPDHLGNAGWLTSRWQQSALWCTEREWRVAHAVRQESESGFETRLALLRCHGVGEGALSQLKRRGDYYPRLVPTLPDDFRCLRDGDELVIGGQSWQVLTVRGHSPEHACLLSAEAGVLISGDQVLPKITTNVSVGPEQPSGNPLRLYLDSLDRFQSLSPDTLVLPSHGLPFHGLHERLAQLRHHHAMRLTDALNALVEPRSAADLLPTLFHRELDAHQLWFALGEALAHLHFLESEGRVARVIGADDIHRFHKL